jgi:NADPH-dependent glutamate synthase beta subunit-like oxidoreductase
MQEILTDRANIFAELDKLRAEDARFITITVLDLGKQLEVIYHFEKGKDVINLKMKTDKEEPLSSITGVYSAAFIAENEAQDLFNLKISGLNVDYGGRMLKVESASATTLLKPVVGECPPIMRFFGRCREKCPAMVNVPKYVRQIALGDPEGAYNTVIEQAPLPAILGRVCFAPCEEGCRQDKNEKPLRNRLLKRYAADALSSLKRDVKRMEPTGKKVAVVGGGPSGITAAFYLGMLGHSVTVYEKMEQCGGAMFAFIPKYRLPKNILGAEAMARFEEAGVKLETGIEITNLDALFKKGFDAIYVATGAWKGMRLMIEGEDSPGVLDCVNFLFAVNVHNERPELGDRVAVIGGGNGAVDAARTVKRLGSQDVTIFYRRSREEMPATLEQVQAAMEEGVSLRFLGSPVKIIPSKPLKVIFQNMRMGEPDESGRHRFVPIEGSEFVVEVDTLIKAIGQAVEVPKDFGLRVDKAGRIVVNEETYETSVQGVWAGGDAMTGPTSVIDCIKDGRIAASAIDKYLGGKGLPQPSIDLGELVCKPSKSPEILERTPVPARVIPIAERIESFDEVELGFNKEEATKEANRCWRCDWNE